MLLATAALASAGHLSGHHGAGSYGGDYGGGYESQENYEPPQPYEFGYTSQDPEGIHGHMQTSDGKTVRGHYEIQLADGNMRRVEYHADENGFRAKVITNELGTESKSPADAVFESSALTGEQAAQQYGSGPKSSYGGEHHGRHQSGHHGGHTDYNKW
ncbi:cuticle protein 10.9-like [Tropilaelaps mercedesae]|uniref:Cuticle protein 10.9-like n=1 Tax=Tropilaelaps mercedesae TaxID=418985 RepID=A0A1V9X1L2_9ACAR|nr:cuticle protein 10.9-like [Tropilaelaps mercedesae]